jgi:hypothetical protein
MGYHTEFSGGIAVKPPLNKSEVEFLQKFNQTRHDGPAETTITTKDGGTVTFKDPGDLPGIWCQWTASDDGKKIVWDEGEKFYSYEEWMVFIIEYFLQPQAKAASELPFLQANHICNGTIHAEGEEGEKFRLVVENNKVRMVE